jgi:single-strand DNA-binding protein
MNVVVVCGVLARDPDERVLASGDLLLSMDVTVRPPDGPATSVPVVWFGPPAGIALGTGQEVLLVGEVRRRFFRAGGATQSRTEVVVQHLVAGSDRRRRAGLLERATGVISAGDAHARKAGAGAAGAGARHDR